MKTYGHWQSNLSFKPDDYFGFIYQIYCLRNGKEYIGKKQFTVKSKYKVNQKGNKLKKKNKIVRVASKWKTYTSSSEYVNEDIKNYGIGSFRFIIKSVHKSKSSLHYEEVRQLVLQDALRIKLANGERKFYNRAIPGVKFLPLID